MQPYVLVTPNNKCDMISPSRNRVMTGGFCRVKCRATIIACAAGLLRVVPLGARPVRSLVHTVHCVEGRTRRLRMSGSGVVLYKFSTKTRTYKDITMR